MKIRDLATPALLLDLEKLRVNLQRMARRTRRLGVRLRPHIKTHKSPEVARLQTDLGASGFTVSTLHEAATFLDAGHHDLTWAFPVVPGRIDEAASLDARAREAGEGGRLRLLVDGPEAVDRLVEAGHPFHVYLKIDCGYGRAGVDPESDRPVELSRRLQGSDLLTFEGLLTHSGQAYAGRSSEELAQAAEEERAVMVGAAERLRAAGLDVPEVSVGSTPAVSRAERLDGVTEARPGNYAFYDFTQTVLGSCDVEDCALTVLATVVSSQPGAEHSVVDAGALALSKDPGPDGASPSTMGEIFADYEGATLRSDARLRSLSQEHGVVSERLPHGQRIRILPNHSCLTAACFDEYHVVRDREVVDRWPIHRGRS